MIYLLLCIISSSFLMVIFKISGRRNLDTYKVIVINYIVAALVGFSIIGFPTSETLSASWLPFAIIIGVLFIVIFLVMAYSTQRSGIAVTTVATKMSVIIPISFSIFYFNETITFLKVAGIIMAMVAVYLTIYKKDKEQGPRRLNFFLPLTLFLGSGLIDTLIKYSQAIYLEENGTIMFTSTLFMIAAISGLIYSPFRRKPFKSYFKPDILVTGIILGLVNFGSLFGIVMALESNVFDSSIIFGINNIGIVVLSVLLALAIFSENLTKKNIIGIILSVAAILILSLVK